MIELEPIKQLLPIETFFSIIVLWPIKQLDPIKTFLPIRTFFPNFTLSLYSVFVISVTELSKESSTESG